MIHVKCDTFLFSNSSSSCHDKKHKADGGREAHRMSAHSARVKKSREEREEARKRTHKWVNDKGEMSDMQKEI